MCSVVTSLAYSLIWNKSESFFVFCDLDTYCRIFLSLVCQMFSFDWIQVVHLWQGDHRSNADFFFFFRRDLSNYWASLVA